MSNWLRSHQLYYEIQGKNDSVTASLSAIHDSLKNIVSTKLNDLKLEINGKKKEIEYLNKKLNDLDAEYNTKIHNMKA